MAVNEAWHRAHPMPPHASLDERIRWHGEHAQTCGCRPIPDGLRKEMDRRAKERA